MTGIRTPRWRVLGLEICCLLVGLVLCGRLVHLQVFRHDELRAKAERQWKHLQETAPERGNMYDRSGRPLALSVTKWRVGVATSLIDDPAVVATAIVEVLGPDLLPDLGPEDLERRLRRAKRQTAGKRLGAGDGAAQGAYTVVLREALLAGEIREALAGITGVEIERLTKRVYPLDGLGASLIGCFRQEPDNTTVAAGLERSLASHLDGDVGREWLLETARPGESLGSVVVEQAVHGSNLVLTLDARLQEICEDELDRSVAESGAIGGSVLIVDPANGDVLAAASWPLVASRRQPGRNPEVWNNRNFTCQYEPGSVFKIFSAASLLSNAAIDTTTVYDCSDTDFGRFTIRNDDGHSYGPLSFMQAFAKSSNIYIARAVANLSPEELYRDLVEFGFGQRTRFPFASQPKGILRPPASWSGRSQATIAIGQEIAVTPLQLAMAVCTVANGGYLYAPRIVKEIRDRDNRLVDRIPPEMLRRVLTAPMADLLRQAMARAVREGTGAGTDLPWVAVGGKTGTAQKSRDGNGYTPGCYVASFAGCVPIDSPRLVVLTTLDEPTGFRHYAAQSAVPLFARVITEIRRCTEWLDGLEGSGTEWVQTTADSELLAVPDVVHLRAGRAADILRHAGLTATGDEKDGVVVEQIPGPGSLCGAGASVRLTVASNEPRAGGPAPVCPDLRGMSNREVRALAARLGLPVAIEGAGYVAQQTPAPGVALNRTGVRVKMARLRTGAS